MKKNKVLLALLAFLLLMTTSCDLMDSDDDSSSAVDTLDVIGTWTEDLYNGTQRITSTYYDNGYSSGTIVNFKNESLNAGSTTSDSDGYGYFTVLFDAGSGIDKYGVVRWKNLETSNGTTTMSISEGYYDADSTDSVYGTYYDTAAEAEAGMDDDYFSYYTDDYTETINIIGTWTEDLYSGTVTITSTYYDNGYSSGTIVNFKNNALNADSTTTDSDGYGYFTVLFDAGSGNGKYGVVRFKNYEADEDSTTMSISEGYYDADSTDSVYGTYYDTAAEAEAGMDDDYFSYYTDNYTLN